MGHIEEVNLFGASLSMHGCFECRFLKNFVLVVETNKVCAFEDRIWQQILSMSKIYKASSSGSRIRIYSF